MDEQPTAHVGLPSYLGHIRDSRLTERYVNRPDTRDT